MVLRHLQKRAVNLGAGSLGQYKWNDWDSLGQMGLTPFLDPFYAGAFQPQGKVVKTGGCGSGGIGGIGCGGGTVIGGGGPVGGGKVGGGPVGGGIVGGGPVGGGTVGGGPVGGGTVGGRPVGGGAVGGGGAEKPTPAVAGGTGGGYGSEKAKPVPKVQFAKKGGYAKK